jgi:hypothetical protein
MKKVIIPFLLLSLMSLPLAAQDLKAQQEAMKKMDFMVGKWKGEGWVEVPGAKRETFTQTEHVQKKLDGLALLVEGHGTAPGPGKGEEITTFRAIALLTYDEAKGLYRFAAISSQGGQGYNEARLVDGGWEWTYPVPQASGRVRYTIKLTDKGEWHEVGEFSRDEKTWRKFHEMTLKKVE